MPQTALTLSPQARAERELPAELFIRPGWGLEEAGRCADHYAKGLVRQARISFLKLAPTLWQIRERGLYTLDFRTFEDWCAQPEIDLSLPKANDIINWWLYAMPQIEACGISPEEVVDSVGDSKMRRMVPMFRDAALKGEPLSDEDVHDVVAVAQGSTWKELDAYLKGRSDESRALPDPEIEFRVTRDGDRWTILGTFDYDEMVFIGRKLRCTWLHPRTGEILRIQRDD